MSDEQHLPWMKMWVYDFIGKTVMWPGVAAGLYAQCLILEWAHGPLPDDAAVLASILKYNPATFATVWATVRTAFQQTADGRLVNPALEAERAEAYKLRTKLSDAGKDGARKRWKEKHGNSKANGQANDHANAHQHHVQHHVQNQPSTSQTRECNAPPISTHLFTWSKGESDGWKEVRAEYPGRHANRDWGDGSRHACMLVRGNRATWPSLRIGARKYANYCASTQIEPMSVVEFFGSGDEHWLNTWGVYGDAEELDETRNKDARH